MHCNRPWGKELSMPKDFKKDASVDLFIIGGGVNGCGIARNTTAIHPPTNDK